MNRHADKEELNKGLSAASNPLQGQRRDKSTFQFVDNRPVVQAQRRRQEMVNIGHHTLQMVKGRNAFLENSRDPKRVFKHTRSLTTYGKFNSSGKNRQGPHRLAHVTTSVVVDVAGQHKRKLSSLVGTKIILRPRINNAILRRGFAQKGAQAMTPALRKKKIEYLKRYSMLYKKAKKGDDKAAELLMEMQALQTYKWAEGFATDPEMAGKGERRGAAVDDLEKARNLKKGAKLPKGLQTFDQTGMKPYEAKLQAGRFRQMGMLMDDEALSDAESIGSDSDSDVDMDE